MRLALVAAYAATCLMTAIAAGPIITPDSFGYAAQSKLSVLDPTFWGSQHPPLLPLLWKLDPYAVSLTHHGLPQFEDVRPLILLNVVIGVACWASLAYVATALCRRRWVAWSVFIAVLLLSLSPEVTGWEGSLLSESLAISLTALLAAVVILYLRDPGRWRAIAVAVVILALAATRDTTVILSLGVAGALVYLVRRHRAWILAGLALGLAVVAWGNHASDQRSRVPLRNSYAWALQFEKAGPWFARHGMPVRQDTESLLLWRPSVEFETAPQTAHLRRWLDQHGRRTWYLYLFEHPGFSLGQPLQHLPSELAGDRSRIRLNLADTQMLEHSLYRGGVSFWIEVLVAVCAAAAAVRTRVLWVVFAAVGGGALLTILVIPDLDRLELQRHLVVAQISFRLLLLAAIVAALDRVPLRALGRIPRLAVAGDRIG